MANKKSTRGRVIKHFGSRTSSRVQSHLDKGPGHPAISVSPEPQNADPLPKRRKRLWTSQSARSVRKPLDLTTDLGLICEELPPELKVADEFRRAYDRVGRNPLIILADLKPEDLKEKVWFALHGDRPMPTFVEKQFAQ